MKWLDRRMARAMIREVLDNYAEFMLENTFETKDKKEISESLCDFYLDECDQIGEILSPYIFVDAFVNGSDMEFTKCEEIISKAREQEKILFDGDGFAIISLDGFERWEAMGCR